jgi:hypothetical protein
MGLLGAGAYFLPSLWPRALWSRAEAQATPPRRLLCFITQHGNPYYDWSMRRPGLAEDGAWELDLGPMSQAELSAIYAPLHPFRNKLLILDTLSNPVGLEMKGGGGGHFGGPASLLTGSTITDDKQNRATGPSLDQLVAEQVFVAGGVRSIELAVGNPYPAIWGAGGASLPVRSAAQVFDDVFAGRDLGSPAMPMAPTAQPAPLTRAERIALARRDILDHTRERYRSLASHITSAERARLETHADLIGDLASTLPDPDDPNAGSSAMQPAVSAGCYQPQSPSYSDLDAHVRAMGELVAAAFACDLTRVASIQLPQMRTSDFGGPAGADVHQDIAHHGDQSTASYGEMVKYYRKHAEHFAAVLSALDGIEEPDGTRVLDNTIVLWGQECGSWIHQMSHLAIVLAGGGGFRMGRYLHWGNIDAVGPTGGNGGNNYANVGPSVSRLLVSIAQQMGLSTNQVGNASSAFGVPMTGPLDRLL